jgi:hypothetical protein
LLVFVGRFCVCASHAVVLAMFQKKVVHFCATDLKRLCAFSFFESLKAAVVYIVRKKKKYKGVKM